MTNFSSNSAINGRISRRALLEGAVKLGALAAAPSGLLREASAASDELAARRAQMAATPIEAVKLTNVITMFTGPGGNVVVRNGEEGKVVVDTFVQGAFAGLKQRLDDMAKTPILFLINTHWHFDHTDNNESFRKAEAEIWAQENTKKRLMESHDLMGMHIPPAPADALPTHVFSQFDHIEFNLPGTEEFIDMEYAPRAHTDSDITVRFVMGDVLHLGDTFFNGMYPFIDLGTGGSINGMIAATENSLKIANPGTKIVPGHGPLGDRDALMKYQDMLVTVRDRVEKLKKSGRSEQQVLAAKPTMDLDESWGKGFVKPEDFVSIVYRGV
jgi:cyclase